MKMPGDAAIESRDGGCYMVWYPPNDSSGFGYYANGVLTINFTFKSGGQGVVRYIEDEFGDMDGVWWMLGNEGAQGTESLTWID
jgi:hypothetical protein